ncbi:MAG: hypothetical protein ABMA00_14100 [Gemmatimonas sp.]
MILRRGLATLVAIVALGGSSQVAVAQAALTVSAGASLPMGDYGKYANTGYLATVGLLFKVGEKGLSVGGQGLFGANSHSDYDGDKTTLMGALGSVVYRLGDATKPGVSLIGNVGMLQHKYSSDQFPNEEGSSSGVAYGGGAAFTVPRGRMSVYLAIRYLMASIENETTAFVPIQAGVTIPLGGNK